MSQINLMRRAFLGAMVSAGSLVGVPRLFGEDPVPGEQKIRQVNNVQPVNVNVPPAGQHPLDPALDVARERLKYIQENVIDYSCYILKRERVSGKAYDPETIIAKIRNRKVAKDGTVKTPFAVSLYFMKPEATKGRQVAYVEDKNNGKLVVREAGLLGRTVGILHLDPNGTLAKQGNRYPIMEIGIENLIVKLIERGQRERNLGSCVVEFRKNAAINQRKCTVIEVIHPVRKAGYEFNLAQIFLDDDLQVPIRYAAYDWPNGVIDNPEPKPDPANVLEEYTYLDMKLNVGLKDSDFVVK